MSCGWPAAVCQILKIRNPVVHAVLYGIAEDECLSGELGRGGDATVIVTADLSVRERLHRWPDYLTGGQPDCNRSEP